MRFLSPPPGVALTKAFSTPFRNVVATARTCYSSRGIVADEEVGPREKYAPLAHSIYEAGHHTTFQHAHFQFTLENVSRLFVWSFLHAHPFYNSEQVSQRYVAVKADTALHPDLGEAAANGLYAAAMESLFTAYERLSALLEGPAESEYHKRFPRSPRMEKQQRIAIRKKAQEIARYVLPLATTTYLYHTVSGITLLRYWRLANQADVPSETRAVVGRMVELLLEADPEYELILQEPLEADIYPETAWFQSRPAAPVGAQAAAFAAEFDASLEGRTSRLVSHQQNAPRLVADAVRGVLGVPASVLDDEAAIGLALDPSQNRLLGESLNLTTLHKAGRALVHAHYTFRKRLSHAADSQDQRHRMTPASRPMLAAHLLDAPDVVVPELIDLEPEARRVFDDAMARLWETMNRLRAMGVDPEAVPYLLPNAAVVRMTESADLLNLRHKHQMRLCYNAQEEIWRASQEEALQIREVHPALGRFLLPPCGLRLLAKAKPICPEGKRYCGVRVWKLDLAEYERVI